MEPIAHIETEFSTKFGIPRQPGLVPQLRGRVIFEPRYRNPDAVRGLEGFSHIWLLWQFSEAIRADWAPTVRPPRLGGNQSVGVFASRSPFRPNSIGISVVELIAVEADPQLGPVLIVGGADLKTGTPILDVKPYIPADRVAATRFGYIDQRPNPGLRVELSDELAQQIPPQLRDALVGVLAQDPRPAYQDDPTRSYGFEFGGLEIKFKVKNDVLEVLTVTPKSA